MLTHVRRRHLYEWIMELNERGIKEFQFRDLPDDLKFQGGLQKARDLYLLESMGVINGRHIWKIVMSNVPKKTMNSENKKEYKKEGIKMSLEPVKIWIGELKKRGIKTFEHKDLPEDLKDRTMIIKAKYANAIKKSKVTTAGPKGSSIRIVWEIT
jgi:hypothetical protein